MPAVKVSICIPAYKQPESILRALESIKTQTYGDYEVIVTDDSPDASVEDVVKQFSLGEKLKYYKNKSTLGSPENWNEAIRRATGEYIKILHHDDWFVSPDSLAQFVKMLDEHPEAEFAFSATSIFNAPDGKYSVHRPSSEHLKLIREEPGVLFLANIIGAPSVTIFRRAVQELFDKNIKYVVDIDFYIRLIQRNRTFQYCDETLICTIGGTEDRVTAACLNKNTQLYEYGYLYNKFYKRLFGKKKYRSYFRQIFLAYNVLSIHEFKEVGVELPEPTYSFKWMLLKINIKRALIKILKGK